MKIEYGTTDEIRGIIDRIGSWGRDSIEILKRVQDDSSAGSGLDKNERFFAGAQNDASAMLRNGLAGLSCG